MKRFSIITLSFLILLGCSSDPTANTDEAAVMADVPVTVSEIKVGNVDDVKTVAELEIEGMTCAIGCAKMIKKTVSDLDGVKIAEVNFDADNPIDIAIVEYNPEEINELEMAAVIQSLVDGQYKVNKILVKKYVYSETLNEEVIEVDQTSELDIKYSFPNILEVFTLIVS
jgi:mercuric ion binding protein